MTVKFWLGILLGVLTLACLVLTVAVMFAVMKLGISKRKSPIYIISAAHMLCDCVQHVLAIGYLAPSIITDSWLFSGGSSNGFVLFLGAVFLFCWYYCSVAQILMAVNRVVVVCKPSIRFFTFANVLIIVILLFPVALFVTWISQYVSPCCQFSFDHVVLSYSYIAKGDSPNYSNMYINLPLNSSSSAICAICYTYIIIFVWKMSHLYNTESSGSGRRLREYKYALQFCAISIFYLTVWITFRLFPILIGVSGVEYFIIVSVSSTINASANAVVYITSNSEVQRALSSTMQSTVVRASTVSHHVKEHAPQLGRSVKKVSQQVLRHI